MNSRPLISFIGKSISNSLKSQNFTTTTPSSSLLFNKSSPIASTFLKSNSFLKLSTSCSNNITSNSTATTLIYKFNNLNEFKKHFSTNVVSNNSNNNNKEAISSIKDFDEIIKQEIENKNKNSNKHNSANPISSEAHLIFEHIDKYKFKIMFFIGIAQFVMFLFILEEYIVKPNPTRTDFWVVVGGGLLTVVTQLFFKSMGKKQIAAIHTYNKGRVLEITSYGMTGFPNRKRICNINNLISAPGNDRIASPVSNQKKSFFIKFPGDITYYQCDLDGSNLVDTNQLEKVIHFSKAEQHIKQANKMNKKNAK